MLLLRSCFDCNGSIDVTVVVVARVSAVVDGADDFVKEAQDGRSGTNPRLLYFALGILRCDT